MPFADTELRQNLNIMPQVAHKNSATSRNQINKWILHGFNVTEVIVLTFLFLGLYIYRISLEFDYLTVENLIETLPRFKEYLVFFSISMSSYIYWLYNYKLLQTKSYLSRSFIDESFKVFKSISYAVLTSIGVAFLFKITNYSRLVVILYWGVGFISIISLRGIKQILMIKLAKKGILVRNVLVIGAGNVGVLLTKEFQNRPGLGCRVIGFLDDIKQGTISNDINVLGKTSDLHRIIKRYPVDEIIITIPSARNVVDRIIKEYRKYNITIRIIPEMYNLVSKSIEVGFNDALPYVTLVKTPMRGLKLSLKRVIEWLSSLMGVLVLSPLFFIISLLIKVDSKGPILYKQKRIGKDGKYFYMYKFRSMVPYADQVLKDLVDQNEVEGPAFKMKNDPRITKVGKFIRKYSLDELPQLFNVLRGEMSLIGPRPPLPSEVTEYGDWEWRRLEVLPGITGLWQVSGRSDLSFQQWVNLDIYYIENWSFFMDLKILLKTIPAVIKGEGAY